MVAKVVVFDQIRNTPKPYYSPDIYCNVNEPIIIRPRKKIVVVFCNSSKYDRQTDQYQVLFSKGHYLYKMNKNILARICNYIVYKCVIAMFDNDNSLLL